MENFSFVIEKKLAGSAKPGLWPSSLDQDLEKLSKLGIDQIVSMSDSELDKQALQVYNIRGFHFHVKDYYPPTLEQLMEMVNLIENGKTTLVHCNAGMGRTGTVLAAYLVYQGVSAVDAIAKVRSMRKGSVQTFRQEDALKEFEQHLMKLYLK